MIENIFCRPFYLQEVLIVSHLNHIFSLKTLSFGWVDASDLMKNFLSARKLTQLSNKFKI